MKKIPFSLALCGLLIQCSAPLSAPPDENDTFNKTSGAVTEAISLTEEPLDEINGESYFYFSYDDSASTAAVELTKYRLLQNKIPDPSLARVWEFLNYETFDSASPQNYGPFQVSMGLWQRPSLTDDRENDYKLGVYIASPILTHEERKNLVLTLVIDVSGSMDSNTIQVEEQSITRLGLVKYGLNQMKFAFKDGDIINIVTFSDQAEIILENHGFTGDSGEIYDTKVNSLVTISSTNLSAGIDRGYEAARETYDSSKLNRVLILTDAYANQGEVDAAVISNNIRIEGMEGIYFSGIGIGDNFNEAFLNELTDTGRGAYFSMLTKRDAWRIFNERFIALLMVAAKDVLFRLDYPTAMTHASTASEESSTDPEDVQPTNFSYNTSQYFFEGFYSSSSAVQNSDAFTLTISYKDPYSGQLALEKVTLTVAEILTLQKENIKNAEIIFLLNQLIGGTMEATEVNTILDAFYSNYSSDLYDEYKDLIDRYIALDYVAP